MDISGIVSARVLPVSRSPVDYTTSIAIGKSLYKGIVAMPGMCGMRACFWICASYGLLVMHMRRG